MFFRSFYFFFFFQAEDGIRDRNVTGVQTCALPIWCRGRARRALLRPPEPGARAGRGDGRHDPGSAHLRGPRLPRGHGVGSEIGRASCRKEGRSRWSPEQEKKKKREAE